MSSSLRLGVRVAMGLVALVLLGIGSGFWMRARFAVAMWPWQNGKLSYLFVASILLAEGVTIAWTAASMELNAARGGALGFAAMNGGIAGYMGYLYSQRQQSLLLAWAFATGLLALGGLALFYLGGRVPWRDTRPVHKFVRISFLLFALALFTATTLLLVRAPIVFPWKLNPDSSVIFGFLFLASACYFFDGWLRPGAANARGQLLGFFVYDLVLIPPYVQHWPKTKGGFRISLIIYLTILFWSAALAVWFWLSDRAKKTGDGSAVHSDRAAG